MNFIKRGLLFLTRKKTRSISMLLILLLICTSIISAFTIKASSEMAQKTVSNDYQNVLLTPRKDVLLTDSHGEGELNKTEIDKIRKLDVVKGLNASQISMTQVKGLKALMPSKSMSGFEVPVEEDPYFSVLGNTNTAYDAKFTTGMMTLSAGRHLNEQDKDKILVHQKFAELNHLKLGDTVSLSKDPIHYKGNQHDPIVAEIVGIFSGQTEGQATYPEEMIENTFLGDEHLISLLYGYTEKEVKYYEVNFHLKKDADIAAFAEKVKTYNINWKVYDIAQKDPLLQTYNRSLKILTNTVGVLYVGILGVAVSILILISIFWVNMKQRETGILLAIGRSKAEIIIQYAFEIMLISIIAIGISLILGEIVGNHLSHLLVQNASSTAQHEVMQEMNSFQLGADTYTDMVLQTVKNNYVDLNLADYLKFLVLLVALTTGSTLVALTRIIRLKPKQILTKFTS